MAEAPNNIRLVLADDHPLVRKGLIQFFEEEDGVQVVAECGDGAAALEAIREKSPDVVLLDLQMPKMNGIQVVERARQLGLDPKAILLVGSIREDDVIRAMRVGIRGIVLKEMAPSLLLQAIRKVAAGGNWIEKESMARAMDQLLDDETRRQMAPKILTARELEIVRMVYDGLRNREIGEKLFISEGTVKSHLHTIYEKLGVKTRVQLVSYVRENRLV